MTMPAPTFDPAFQAAAMLPPEARAAIADALTWPDSQQRKDLATQLRQGIDEERQQIDALWATEVKDRIAAAERGEIALIPVDEVLNRLRSKRAQ